MPDFIYVLINPSIPDQVKVGTTSRTPEERAIELSANTNMPTPFIVAHSIAVEDGPAVERAAHSALAGLGARVNGAREFFRISLEDAVRIVTAIAESSRRRTSLLGPGNGDVGQLVKEQLSKARDAEYGRNGQLVDEALAFTLYRSAFELGSVEAAWSLGECYVSGKGTRKSISRAIEAFKYGAEKRDPVCCSRLWNVYSGNSFGFWDDTETGCEHYQNSEISYGWLLESADAFPPNWLTGYLDYLSSRRRNGAHTLRVLEIIKRQAEMFVSIGRYLYLRGDVDTMRSYFVSPTLEGCELGHLEAFIEYFPIWIEGGEEVVRTVLADCTEQEIRFMYSAAPDDWSFVDSVEDALAFISPARE